MTDYQQEITNAVARLACTAYWRGKLEALNVTGDALEIILKHLGKTDEWEHWVKAAEVRLSGCYFYEPKGEPK